MSPPVGDAPRPRPPGNAMLEKHGSGPWSRGEGVIPQGQLGKECLPHELRVKLFDEVAGLRRKRLSYKRIIDEVWRNYGIRLSKSHISYWLRGVHSPYNRRYIPSIDLLRPSEELAYVIGVVLGDGYTTRERRTVKDYNDVRIGLKVKDVEFADEFARCLAKVLGRHPPKPFYDKKRGRYVVVVGSKTFYELLKKPVNLDRLKKYIEHSEDCVATFLRGFADSEGSVDKSGYIRIANTDLVLLTYVKDLLQRLGVTSTGPWLSARQGGVFHDPATGKPYITKKDCYYIHIQACSNLTFYRKVGLTIKRKRRHLEEYLRRRQAKPPSPPLSHLIHLSKITHNTISPGPAGLEPATTDLEGRCAVHSALRAPQESIHIRFINCYR